MRSSQALSKASTTTVQRYLHTVLAYFHGKHRQVPSLPYRWSDRKVNDHLRDHRLNVA
jgi:hypothetical protein